MANRNTITELIAAIKTIYPYYAKEADVKALVKTWELLLYSYSDNDVKAAMIKCLQTCKTPPTPADVIEQLTALKQSKQLTSESLWGRFLDTMHKVDDLSYRLNFTFVEDNGLTQGQNARNKISRIWEQLPQELKSYIGSQGELIRMAREYDDTALTFEKARFLKALPSIRESHECQQVIAVCQNPDLKMMTNDDVLKIERQAYRYHYQPNCVCD